MKKKLLIIVMILTLVSVTGCIKINKKKTGPDAGVFKSFDKGITWATKRNLVLPEGIGSISSVNVTDLYFDPQDSNAIYLLSEGNGLLYTYDGGENWFQPSSLATGHINDVKVDPNNKCVIYITWGNRVMKSVDCNRSWQEKYIDTRPKNISAIAVDSKDSSVIYAGNVNGEIIKSYNGGNSWTTIQRFGGTIERIIAHPLEGNTFYIVIKGKGLHKTADGGATWLSLDEGLKRYSGYNEIYNLVMNQANPDNLFLICRYGIIKTTDGGATWEALELITPPLSTRIYAFAVNPKDSNELFYATASTFYKTIDGGKKWSTKRLPTTAAASYMLIDPINPNIIYLGARNLSTK